MTVEENLEMGAFLINEDYKNIIDEIYDLFPILKEKRNQLVGELSGCLLYTSPSPRDAHESRMPSSA